jgi:hypothetical protein
MSGPIVRTGTTPAFWQNWDNVFGKKTGGKKKEAPKATQTKTEKKKKS